MPENPYKNLPPFLYKYRYFDDDGYHLQLLTDGKLYCSSPMNFNDPFDCVVRIDYSSPTDNDILQKYIRLEKYQYPNLEHSKIVEIAKEKASTIDKKPLEDSELMKSRILDHISNYIGIFSLSGEESNILLWSHYSDSHKGFLVEFNALYLKNFLVNTYLPLNQKHLLFDVGYSNTYKLINAYSTEYDTELMKAFLTKSPVWSYEKEWRILYYGGANKFIEIPSDLFSEIVTRVIIGSKVHPKDENKIISILKNRNIPIQKAFQSEDKFDLIYKDIN